MVLTGASRGIGHATVKRFSEAGWRIITCSRSPLHPSCPWDAGEENHLQIDLASHEEIARGVDELMERLDGAPLHALVNNAGISPKNDSGDRMDSMSTPLDVWHGVFQVNVFAPVMLARALIEPLQKGNGTVTLQVKHCDRSIRRDVGVAVAVTADPRAKSDRHMIRPHFLANIPQGCRNRVKKIGQGFADGLGKVVKDKFGFVERVRSFVADLVGLPDGLDHLINAPVDTLAFNLRTAHIPPRF